jgi:hypothetical protein
LVQKEGKLLEIRIIPKINPGEGLLYILFWFSFHIPTAVGILALAYHLRRVCKARVGTKEVILLETLGRLGSGELVLNRHGSHLHNGLNSLLSRALNDIICSGKAFLVEEVDFGRIIGETVCVETGSEDQIVYAKRPKRCGHSRFVLNRTPEPCSSMVILLKKAEEDDFYVCITAFIGHKAEPEPWDRNATEKSSVFWSNHALIWGQEEIIPGTETVKCPW